MRGTACVWEWSRRTSLEKGPFSFLRVFVQSGKQRQILPRNISLIKVITCLFKSTRMARHL